jgi:hypothetical protein
MRRLLRQLIGDESGLILPLVLVVVALGGLTITPMLDYAATSLRGSRTVEKGVSGMFAADAGVAYVLWCLDNSISPPAQLPETINGMDVSLAVVDRGEFTVYFGQLIQASAHSDYLDIAGDITGNEYTITVTWQSDPGSPVIHIEEVGAMIPAGFSYEADSASGFPGNLASGEPDQTVAAGGGWLLNWELSPPYPDVSEAAPVRTQTFRLTGAGDPDGSYAWVVASRADIGATGEISGNLYDVTVTASQSGGGGVAAVVDVGIISEEDSIGVVSWEASR